VKGAVRFGLVAACVSLATSSCSWVSASPYDYADYRTIRVGKTQDQRLSAAAKYLRDRPDGAYARSAREYFDRHEPQYFAERQKSPAGLAAYLETLPNGPHAVEARSRLQAIREQASRPDPLLVAAAATRERLERAAAGRQAAQESLETWLSRLVDPAVFASPLADGPRELVVAYSLSLPPPACRPLDPADRAGARVCQKEQALAFDIPVDKKLTERELSFTVELEQDAAGTPRRASVAGDELFSRLAETYAKAELSAERVRDRIDAVERGVDFVQGVFEKKISTDPTCRRDVVAPIVLALECGGVRVEVKAGDGDGALDEIVVTPSAKR
jgi:hypothetical protein